MPVGSSLEAQLSQLRNGDHVGAVYQDSDSASTMCGSWRAAATFIRHGLDANQRCICIFKTVDHDLTTASLRSAGLAIDDALRRRAVVILDKTEALPGNGGFDPHDAMRLFDEHLNRARADGLSGLRICIDLTCMLGILGTGSGDLARLVKLSLLLNQFVQTHPASALSLFDRARLPQQVIRDVIRTHPQLLVNDQLCRNFFFEPVDLVLSAEHEPQRIDWMLQCVQSEHARGAAVAESARRGAVEMRRLIDAIPAGAYTCDEHGLITYYNSRAVEIWGREPLLNDSADRYCGSFKLYNAQQQPISHNQCWMALALKNDRTYDAQEIIIQRHDGARATVLAHARPLHDELGNLIGALNVLIDITDRKRIEQRAVDASRSADDANRAKDRFLAVLSHELRTPLAPVLMTLDSLAADVQLSDHLRDDIAMIRRNVELESKLIDDLLDLDCISTGRVKLAEKPTMVHEIVEHIVATRRADAAAKRVTIELRAAATDQRISADPARLQQVLCNVIDNAIKFSPGGSVIVSTSNPRSHRLQIEVRDTGAGIAQNKLKDIFKAFASDDAQDRARRSGLGIGLAVASAIVRLHGGMIRADSAGAGRGTTITIELATLDANKEAAMIAPLDTSVATSSGRRGPIVHAAPDHATILLVEDHVDSANILARVLRQSGFAVSHATTVKSALELADAQRFDLLISDIGLPDATGYDLMQQLRVRQRIKGIALSGYGMDEDVRRSREAGFADHLIKPINVQALSNAIAKLIASAPVA